MRRLVLAFVLLVLVFLVLGISSQAHAQKQFNTWYFGNYVGLDFNVQPPTLLLDGSIVTGEGSACVSDPVTGKILFYTDGRTVYNRNHIPMPRGNGWRGYTSSTQAALITRDPTTPERYYVFITSKFPNPGNFDGISYLIVDMREDNGLGDVVYDAELMSGMSEKLMAVGTKDERSYWVIGQEMNSNRYRAWMLNEDGLDVTSVVSTVGAGVGNDEPAAIGWLAASPTGGMLAAACFDRQNQRVELYRFDPATGQLSDPIAFPCVNPYGAAFSSDGSKVYFSMDTVIVQYDVSIYDAAVIAASKQEIRHHVAYAPAMKLGPDGNIYVRSTTRIGRITNTNSPSFEYDTLVYEIPYDSRIMLGLPNDPVLITGVKPRKLSASVSTLDFGDLNVCDERDSVVTLTNTGEGPVTISDATIDRNFRIVGLTLPVTLQPGETLDIHVESTADTSGKPIVLTGTLFITSNAAQPLPPIPLSRGIVYPAELLLEARDDANGEFGSEVIFDVVLTGDVLPGTTIRFDLLHNNDLLSYTSMNASGLVLEQTTGESTQRQSFTLTNASAGVVGTLAFRTFVAAQASTTLEFENIEAEVQASSFAPECFAVFSDSGARFTYTNACGDGMLQQYLISEALVLSSVSPNPSQEWVAIDLETKLPKIEARASLIDALGREVLQMPVTDRNTRIDVSTIPAGTYYLRIGMGGYVRSHKVEIQR